MKNLRSATLIICAVSSMFLGMPALAQEADFSPEMTADDSLTGDGEMDMLLAALPSAESVLAATPGGPVLDVADPAVGAGHAVAIRSELLRDPVDVGFPDRFGDLVVRGVAVAVGAPVERAGSAPVKGSFAPSNGCGSLRLRTRG